MPAGLECEQASRTIHTIVVGGATDDLTLDEIGLTTGDLGEVMGIDPRTADEPFRLPNRNTRRDTSAGTRAAQSQTMPVHGEEAIKRIAIFL